MFPLPFRLWQLGLVHFKSVMNPQKSFYNPSDTATWIIHRPKFSSTHQSQLLARTKLSGKYKIPAKRLKKSGTRGGQIRWHVSPTWQCNPKCLMSPTVVTQLCHAARSSSSKSGPISFIHPPAFWFFPKILIRHPLFHLFISNKDKYFLSYGLYLSLKSWILSASQAFHFAILPLCTLPSETELKNPNPYRVPRYFLLDLTRRTGALNYLCWFQIRIVWNSIQRRFGSPRLLFVYSDLKVLFDLNQSNKVNLWNFPFWFSLLLISITGLHLLVVDDSKGSFFLYFRGFDSILWF